MHAVRIHQFGGEHALRHEEVPDPQPGPGQVRVAVRAASINRGDLARRTGTHPGEMAFPLTLGWEVAGDIDAVGDGIDPQRIGERVVALGAGGGYAERFVTTDAAAVRIPDALAYDVAAPCAALVNASPLDKGGPRGILRRAIESPLLCERRGPAVAAPVFPERSSCSISHSFSDRG
ncbi:MAG: zinc-binding alcohol dehydrogenase family protein [Candidatus Binatia bacterium]